MALVFKAEKRFKVKYQYYTGQIIERWCSGMTKEQAKKKIEFLGYTLLEMGEFEDNI